MPGTRRSFVARLVVATLLVLTAAGSAVAAGRRQVLVFGRAADSVTLDPALYPDMESAKVVANIFEGLVRYREDSTAIEPCLALSWETSGDGRSWIFHLRKNVRFHDGTPFNARAVVFSFRRRMDPGFEYYRPEFASLDGNIKVIESVRAVAEYTVRIHLKSPFAPFLTILAAPFYSIVSPTAVTRYGRDFGGHPVGTGAFRFVRWRKNDKIVLDRFAQYWGLGPVLDRLVFRCIFDNRERLLALKSNAIQIMDGINPEDMNELRARPDIIVDTKPGINVGYLAFDLRKKPFDRLKVRLAINCAINKKNLIRLFYRNLAIPAVNPIPPTLWAYNDRIRDYPYDPQQARALLKEAGYPHGFATTLWVMPVARPYMPQPKKIAHAVQMNLQAVGIKVSLYSCGWGEYLERLGRGEHDMCLLGWVGDTGDPNNFFYYLFDSRNAVTPHAQNVAFFTDPTVHQLIMKAQRERDRAKRKSDYLEIQDIIHRQAPWVPLAHAQQVVAYRSDVSGVVVHPTGVIRFRMARIE